MEWIEVKNNDDIKKINEMYNHFEDAMLVKMDFASGDYVDNEMVGHMEQTNDLILFEGMLELATVSKIVPANQIVYLSVEKPVCEREFFAREDHRGMLDNILNTPDISEDEKQRRIVMCKEAAINAFHVNAKEFGIQTFMREETSTAYEMAEKIAGHFGLAKGI